jgi:hypothetical protein
MGMQALEKGSSAPPFRYVVGEEERHVCIDRIGLDSELRLGLRALELLHRLVLSNLMLGLE